MLVAASIEELLKAYQRFVRLPWDQSLAPAQRIWMAVYDKRQERRLRFRIDEFRSATLASGHGWEHVDLTNAFARWMAGHDYAEEYFKEPEFLYTALGDFAGMVVGEVREVLRGDTKNCVVGVSGLASLFGLTRVSRVLEDAAPEIKGRMLVFYPGENEGSNYRLLDARDGWDYHAVPIVTGNGN